MNRTTNPYIKTKFFVEGKPKPKERPRRGRHGNFYTPNDTRDYQALVAMNARLKGLNVPTDDAWVVEISVGVASPRMVGSPWPTAKRQGDLDNILKSVLDGLQGVVYRDDSQVIETRAEKHYVIPDEAVGVAVTLWPVRARYEGSHRHGQVQCQALSELRETGPQVQVRGDEPSPGEGRSPDPPGPGHHPVGDDTPTPGTQV